MENSSKKSLKNKRIALQNHADNITKFVNNNVVLDLEPLADKLAADKVIRLFQEASYIYILKYYQQE